jgi:hypothetical protein
MQKATHRRTAKGLASERRILPRSEVEAPVVYSFLQAISSRTYDAIACNCSDDGLCMETLYQLSPGQYLSIRKKRGTRTASGIRNGHLLPPYKVAEVRWCRPKSGRTRRRYQVGVRYC